MPTACFWMRILFQFTPLREGRRDERVRECHQELISIHAPAGGATWKCWKNRRRVLFQFTPLREGRQLSELLNAETWLFQFTPLREGRRWLSNEKKNDPNYFNSRPCGRGDVAGPLVAVHRDDISIHAPAGGATRTSII